LVGIVGIIVWVHYIAPVIIRRAVWRTAAAIIVIIVCHNLILSNLVGRKTVVRENKKVNRYAKDNIRWKL